MTLSHTFEDTMSCLKSILDGKYMNESEMTKFRSIQKEIGLLRTLFMSVRKQAPVEYICGKDHRQFWLYFKEKDTTSACTLKTTDCIIMRIQYADRHLAQDLHEIFKYTILDEPFAEVLSNVQEIRKLVEPDMVEACISALQISLQSNASETAHLVLQLFGFLVRSLWNLMNCKSNLLERKEAQMKVDEEKLRLVAVLIFLVSRQSLEQAKLEDILTRFGHMTDNLARLSYLCLIMEMDHEMRGIISDKVSHLLEKINLEDRKCLLDFVDNLLQNLMQMPSPKDQIAIFNREVKILIYFVANSHKEDLESKELYDLLVHIEYSAYKLIFVFCSLICCNDIANELHTLLSEFLQEVNAIQMRFKDIYPKALGRIFSKMDGIWFIDFFLVKLRELSQNYNKLFSSVKLEVESIQSDIEFFKSFVKAIKEQQSHGNAVEKDLMLRCINIAYEVESIIDTFVVNDGPSWDNILWLSDVMEEIEHIKREVSEVYDNGFVYVQKPSNYVLSQTSAPTFNEAAIASVVPNLSLQDIVMGFKDEEEKILGLLTRDEKQLDVISIIGMPGLGKTTLAKKIFNHQSFAYKFDFRLWCVVSQVYKKKEQLLGMLSQLIGPSDRTDKMTVADLAAELRKNLLGKKYLIVVDDVWSNEAWDELIRPFPVQDKGSRILLTSRDEKVALHAKKYSDPHLLRFFTEEESWELLKERVFQKESCPLELLVVGKQIAKNCRGLPLTIVLIAGLLANVDKDPDSWHKVADSFDLKAEGVGEHCMNTIELSYKQLPEHLKPCFLYLAAFPEDKEIPVSKLLLMWIAEGFIPISEQMTLENAAEAYLTDLTSRSLVIVAKSRSTKGVKAIVIHDLVRDFCLAKAEEENFLEWSHRDNLFHSTTSVQYRLCTYYSCLLTKEEMGSSHLRSLLSYNDEYISYYYFRCLPNTFQCFKLLRVLDGGLDGGILVDKDGLNAICMLIHLRYLAIRIATREIKSSIANLLNLQTCLVKGISGEISVSDRIWDMVKLRHMHISDRASFCLVKSSHNTSKLDNLQSCSTPLLRWDREDILRKMPNLRKLNCIFRDSWGYSNKSKRKCNRFPQLEFLGKLESLKALYTSHWAPIPCEFNLPSNLKKLTLSMFHLPWGEISAIAILPNLEVLKLLFRAFDGETWEMEDENFPKLKYLKLENLNLAHWSVSDEAFPSLERLVLNKCRKLVKIPSGFAETYTLQMIEVHGCSHSVEQSALQTQEQLEESGMDGIKVLIST